MVIIPAGKPSAPIENANTNCDTPISDSSFHFCSLKLPTRSNGNAATAAPQGSVLEECDAFGGVETFSFVRALRWCELTTHAIRPFDNRTEPLTRSITNDDHQSIMADGIASITALSGAKRRTVSRLLRASAGLSEG